MLTFLSLAAPKRIIVESYTDKVIGVMEKVDGKLIVSRVELNPTIVYAGELPIAATQAELHHLAHEQCFIANSVKTEIQVAT